MHVYFPLQRWSHMSCIFCKQCDRSFKKIIHKIIRSTVAIVKIYEIKCRYGVSIPYFLPDIRGCCSSQKWDLSLLSCLRNWWNWPLFLPSGRRLPEVPWRSRHKLAAQETPFPFLPGTQPDYFPASPQWGVTMGLNSGRWSAGGKVY